MGPVGKFMSADLLYMYLFDMGWFFLITCAVMVATARIIVVAEDARTDVARNRE